MVTLRINNSLVILFYTACQYFSTTGNSPCTYNVLKQSKLLITWTTTAGIWRHQLYIIVRLHLTLIDDHLMWVGVERVNTDHGSYKPWRGRPPASGRVCQRLANQGRGATAAWTVRWVHTGLPLIGGRLWVVWKWWVRVGHRDGIRVW